MAELTINTNDIVTALRKHLAGFDPAVETKTVGRVRSKSATASPMSPGCRRRV